MKVSIENNEKKECEIKTVLSNSTSKIVALEFDVENNDYMYYLDDEQRLVHINITSDDKCVEEHIYNLSVHSV